MPFKTGFIITEALKYLQAEFSVLWGEQQCEIVKLLDKE